MDNDENDEPPKGLDAVEAAGWPNALVVLLEPNALGVAPVELPKAVDPKAVGLDEFEEVSLLSAAKELLLVPALLPNAPKAEPLNAVLAGLLLLLAALPNALEPEPKAENALFVVLLGEVVGLLDPNAWLPKAEPVLLLLLLLLLLLPPPPKALVLFAKEPKAPDPLPNALPEVLPPLPNAPLDWPHEEPELLLLLLLFIGSYGFSAFLSRVNWE